MDASFEERLCEEIRRYPHLYQEHKDSRVVLRSWREIARTLGRDEKACRQKWKDLRDRYVKAKRRVKSRDAAAGGGAHTSVPPIINMLDWLSGFIRHRSKKSDFQGECEGSSETGGLQLEGNPAGAPAEHAPLYSPGHTPLPDLREPSPERGPLSTSSSGCVSTSSPTRRRSRKRKDRPTPAQRAILEKLSRLERDREQENEEETFGRMVAGMLVKLPEQKRMDAKYEIHHMLYHMHKQCSQEDAK